MKRKNPKVIQERAVTKLSKTERQLKVLEQRKTGKTCREIAEALDVSAMTVSRDLQEILEDLSLEKLEDAREYQILELSRLDELQLAIWHKALKGSPTFITLCLQIISARTKLLGLDNMNVRVQLALDRELEGLLNVLEEELPEETYIRILARIGRKEIITN